MALRPLAAGEFQLAAWTTQPGAGLVEALARSPFDAVVLDMQHGLYDTAAVHTGIAAAAACGKPAIVRVPLGDLAFVSRALDFGASAVILPMIESAADARALVAAGKYPPVGQRSFGPGKAVAVLGLADAGAYVETANASTMVLAMIETAGAYADLDAILAVEGLDGILLGPSDLSLALFGRLDPDGAETIEAAGAIAARARAAGKFASIFASGVEAARRGREQGYDLVYLPFETSALTQAAGDLVAEVRG